MPIATLLRLRRGPVVLVGAALVALSALGAGQAAAQSAVQGVPNAMQGFSQNRDKPIQIESDTLEVRDKNKEATFTGNVKVVQGDTTMTSQSLVVFYDQDQAPAKGAKGKPMPAAAPGPDGASSIRRLEAKGHVVVTQKDQVVTGDKAVFETKTNLVTMTGNVVLTQARNVVRGDRLLVDMTTGVSRVESDSGRVQGLFQSSGASGGSSGGPLPLVPQSGSGKPK
ncbi:LPS ABC transporter substrate-binding protein LptA [Rhodopseudomonas palustris]|uniref:LPS ABC transporter substrate-binding protein LptA n=1 Tax=Rhodopseudomonas palustris TaxID=1076 RepID=A0A323UES8_RHOPL|nr:LptA/OstA family protein [Rhodopseudomonas palustris]PZA10653.1 LPS ABC transporter substrate-binding protein LptA [Rhodopseudomonas palustris]